MLLFKEVTKRYSNGNIGIDNVSVKIEKGEFVFLVGSSGAGKSTFIKVVTKELNPTKGKLYVDGKDATKIHKRLIPLYRRNLGIVFQDYRLLNKMTVYENVAFALQIIGKKNSEIKKEVPRVLNLVGLIDKMKFKPLELSGGEQQRVSIARAIANRPDLLICDEPTGNLDPETSWELMDLLRMLNTHGTTIIMATHDKQIVDRMQRRVIELSEGLIVRDQKVGEYK